MNLLGSALSSIKPRKDDTLIDRLNYYYTSVIIIVSSITLTAKQYVGQPIQCWVPAEFTKAWEQYAENYCFVHNTYWVRPGEAIPEVVDERVTRQLIYYQWVPFLMALEAGFFYLPVIFWAQTNTKSGINITSIVNTIRSAEKGGGDLTMTENIRRAVLLTVQHFEDSVRLRRIRQETASKMDWIWRFGLLEGSYLSNMYSITKSLYILNIIGQFFMIQCVLVLNMFNEKIFLFLYWWLVLIGCVTLIDLILWTMNIKLSSWRISYIRRFIRVVLPEEEFMFREFCDRCVASDGTFLLRIVSANTNELFTEEVLWTLWDNYRSEWREMRKRLSSGVHHVVMEEKEGSISDQRLDQGAKDKECKKAEERGQSVGADYGDDREKSSSSPAFPLLNDDDREAPKKRETGGRRGFRQFLSPPLVQHQHHLEGITRRRSSIECYFPQEQKASDVSPSRLPPPEGLLHGGRRRFSAACTLTT